MCYYLLIFVCFQNRTLYIEDICCADQVKIGMFIASFLSNKHSVECQK